MIPVGKSLPNTTILVLRDGAECDPNEIGEVYIQTAFRSHGYFEDPDRTAESFIPNPLLPGSPDLLYKTGDMGRYGSDGTVVLVGRRDGQVKINGIRIELSEIEQAILAFEPIEQVVVAVHTDRDHENHLAFTSSLATLSRMNRSAPIFHLASGIHAPVVLYPHGRTSGESPWQGIRHGLPQPADLLYRTKPFEPPVGELEETLAAAWDEVLGIGELAPCIHLRSWAAPRSKQFRSSPASGRPSVDVRLEELFPEGTIRQLAQSIAGERRASRGKSHSRRSLTI